MFDRLRAHQDGVEAVMARSEALLATREPDAHALAQTRWELARLLRAYQIYKHTAVFDPIIAAGRADRAALAQRLKAECLRQGDLFTAHLLRWSAIGAADDWTGYRVAVRALTGDLRAHLVRERAGVAQLAGAAPAPALQRPACDLHAMRRPAPMRY